MREVAEVPELKMMGMREEGRSSRPEDDGEERDGQKFQNVRSVGAERREEMGHWCQSCPASFTGLQRR